jgi:hypothetical protein
MLHVYFRFKEIIPRNSTPIYTEAVMRQAYKFTGMNYINVTGIPETFWQDNDWSITALVMLKYNISKPNSDGSYDFPLLGIGTNPGSVQDEMHLGFRGSFSKKEVHMVSNQMLDRKGMGLLVR